MSNEKDFYIYAYYFISTDHIFYIGKGHKNRYKETRRRNAYFKNILAKYKNEVGVKKLYTELSEVEAANLERKLIAEYWKQGACEANFHEGGFGGNTGNYKQSGESLKKFYRENGPLPSTLANCEKMHEAVKGTHQTIEHKQKIGDKMKAYWANLSEEERHSRKKGGPSPGTLPWNAGKHWSEENKLKIGIGQAYKFEVYLNNELIYWCYGFKRLAKFCSSELGISAGPLPKIIEGNWTPKFNKHQHLQTLIIKKLDKSVSTIPDECREVEWRLQPFEARDSQK